MNNLFKSVKDIKTEGCVSIIMNTHRTMPDNQKDPIQLKNLIKEALERLYENFEKRFVWPIEEKLNELADSLDHNENMESLIIFVNPDFSDFVRLPVQVKDRVVIDNTFATRDLIRASYEEGHYYVLQLSRSVARMFEAYNDKLVKELTGEFPFQNSLDGRGTDELNDKSNFISEYFNHVDKVVQEQLKEQPLPVIIVTETRNYDFYQNECDDMKHIVGTISRLPDDEKPEKVVSEAWTEMSQIIDAQIASRIQELGQAASTNSLVLGLNDIWQTVQQGRGKTLFVKKGFIKSAIVDEENLSIQIVDDSDTNPNKVDDIIDEMIEQVIAYGGDMVFIKGDELDQYDNVALITRD